MDRRLPLLYRLAGAAVAIGEAAVGSVEGLGRRATALYAFNSVGVALGAALAAFVLPGQIGVRATPALLAASVSYLEGAAYPAHAPDGSRVPLRAGHLDWLRGREPVAHLGSIWVFDTWPPPRD